MNELIQSIIERFSKDPRTLRELQKLTGINATRVYRIRNGWKASADEIVKLAELYSIEMVQKITYEELLNNAIIQAEKHVVEKYEAIIAQKYGMTPELMKWKLGA